jgi:hypothetical protein
MFGSADVASGLRRRLDARSRAAFLALMAVQAVHSVEECVFRLTDVYAPARFLAGLVSRDPAWGFALLNAVLVLFGLWCYWARVRPAHPAAAAYAWGWTVVELINGTVHTAMAVARGGYFPGLATAPLLLGLSAYLAARLRRPATR